MKFGTFKHPQLSPNKHVSHMLAMYSRPPQNHVTSMYVDTFPILHPATCMTVVTTFDFSTVDFLPVLLQWYGQDD